MNRKIILSRGHVYTDGLLAISKFEYVTAYFDAL